MIDVLLTGPLRIHSFTMWIWKHMQCLKRHINGSLFNSIVFNYVQMYTKLLNITNIVGKNQQSHVELHKNN